MSHQSGIQVSEELTKAFTDAVSAENVRILRVSIVNESLVPNGSSTVESDFESDYKKYIEEYLEDNTPAYLFVRLDEKASTGEYKWLFLCYIPDHAKVRDKMIYASTRATLTRELGDYRFTDNIYGTEKSEFTWDGYKKHLTHKSAEAPLTRREQELAEIKAAEAKTVTDYQGTSTRKSYAPGVVFPLTDKAIEALNELLKVKDERSYNFVSLRLENEQTDLDNVADVAVNDLSGTISENAPRFTYYIYDSEGKESLVFIYTCPSGSKIRERMLYSSSKANIIQAAEVELSVKAVKKFETSDLSDLTKEYFDEELNVKQPAENPTGTNERQQLLGGTKQGFKRPVAPNRRRPGTTSNTSNTSS